MGIKNFFTAIVYGAAITIGAIGAEKGIEVTRDPVKRAKVKRVFNNIKDDLKRKIEG